MNVFYVIFDHVIFLFLGRIILGPNPRKGYIFYCDWFLASASSWYFTWALLVVVQIIAAGFKASLALSILPHIFAGFALLLIVQAIRFRSVKGTRTAFFDSIGFIRESSRNFRQAQSENRILRYFLMVFFLGYAYFIYKGTSVPPYEYDVLSYHIPLAVDFRNLGSLIPYVHRYWHFWFPSNFELWLSTWLIGGRSMSIALAQLPSVIVTLLFTYSLARSIGGSRLTGWISGLIMCASPIILFQAVTPMNELFTLPFITGSILYAVEYLKNGKSMDAVFCGLALGLTIGTKYSFLIVVPALIITMLPSLILRKSRKDKPFADWLRFTGLSVLAVLLMSFWYFRNYLVFGNPFYPLEFQLFGSTIFSGISPVFDRSFELNFVPSRIFWWVFPWVERNYSAIQGWGYLVGGLGSLAFIVYIFKDNLRQDRRAISVFMMIFSTLATILWWNVTQHEPRFLIFLLPLFAISVTLIFTEWRIPKLAGMLILLLLFSLTTGRAMMSVKLQVRELEFNGKFMSFYSLPEEIDKINEDVPIVLLSDCNYGHLLTYPLMGEFLNRYVIVIGMEQFETESEFLEFYDTYRGFIIDGSRIMYYTPGMEARLDFDSIPDFEMRGIYRTRGRDSSTVFDQDNKIIVYDKISSE